MFFTMDTHLEYKKNGGGGGGGRGEGGGWKGGPRVRDFFLQRIQI